MRVLLFGATGMVGSGTLLECLADSRVTSVLSISRSPSGHSHPKLREVLHRDFLDFGSLSPEFAACDACLYCLGVSSVGMNEDDYTRITYDYTMAAARTLFAANSRATFCFVSGVGADSTEKGPPMWARVKGRTENAVLQMGFKAAYVFRPGYIQPIGDVRSKTGWVHAVYTIARPLYPVIHLALPNSTTTTAKLGRAMIAAAAAGYAKSILFSADFNALAA